MSQQPFSHDAGDRPAAKGSPSHASDPITAEGQALCQGSESSPELPINAAPFGVSPVRLTGRGPKAAKRLVSAEEAAASNRRLSPEQKLLILDTWQRSGLSANDFLALVGVNRITLYNWKKRFEEFGPAGLAEQPRKGSGAGKISDLTRRTILMLKKANPQWGC